MKRMKASSSSATKYDERRDRIDSNVAVLSDKRSARTLVSEFSRLGNGYVPLNDHKIVIDVMIIASLPSNHRTSHRRNWWENGTVLTNNVMNHLVPQADELIIFRCYPTSTLLHFAE